MTIISTPITLNQSETKLFIRFSEEGGKFYRSSKNKILGFHGDRDGEIHVPRIFLFIHYILGFSFTCCYPQIVRERLGFGNFLWEDYEGITSVQGVLINDEEILENGQISRCSGAEIEFYDGRWKRIHQDE